MIRGAGVGVHASATDLPFVAHLANINLQVGSVGNIYCVGARSRSYSTLRGEESLWTFRDDIADPGSKARILCIPRPGRPVAHRPHMAELEKV